MMVVRVAVALAALLFAASHSKAETILATYTGTVTNVPAELAADFSVGDLISGWYTFDSSVAARPGSTSDGAVFDALLSFTIKIGNSYVATLSSPIPGREIQIDNGDGSNGLTDRYLVLALASSGLSGPPLSNGMVIDSTGPHLEDSSNAAFSNALVLPTSLNLADFDTKIIDVTFTDAGEVVAAISFPFLEATIDTLTFRPVPEPGSLALLATGACTVFGFGLRRRQKRRSRAAA